MAAEKNSFESAVENLFKGMEGFVTTKTVIGDAIQVEDAVILPLVDISFGMGVGSLSGEKKNNCGGGMNGKITPSAVLVIQDGRSKIISVKNQDSVSKLLDMVPDVVNKFTKKEKEVDIPEDAFDKMKEE